MNTAFLEKTTQNILLRVYGDSKWQGGNICYLDYCEAIRIKSHFNDPADWRWHAALLHDVLSTDKYNITDLKELRYPIEVLSTLLLLDKTFPTYTEWVNHIEVANNVTAITIALQRSRFILDNIEEFSSATQSLMFKHTWTVRQLGAKLG